MEVKTLALEEVVVSSFNTRKHCDEGKLKELAESIKQKGLIEPVIVRPLNGKYELVCGERRFRASKMAGLSDIVARIVKLDDKEALEFQVIENLQREDVHPLEEAEGYEQLMKKHGYKSVDDIAAKVGKSKAYIYGRMKLCELIPENRKFFYDDKLSPSTALLVARIPEHLQKEAGKRVACGRWASDGSMSYREALKWIEEEFMLRLKDAQFDTKEKGIAGKCSCVDCLKRTGNQKELFVDVASADVCTDPECFKAKKVAFTQKVITELKKKGKKVISSEEAKELFQYESSTTPNQKYMALDEHHYDWPSGVTPRKMLKATKDVEIIHAIHPYSGKIIEMVSRTDLPKLFKAAGIKTERAVNTSERRIENQPEERVTRAKRGLWIEKISASMDSRVKNVLLLSSLLQGMTLLDEDDALLDNAPNGDDLEEIYNLGDAQVQKLIARCIFIMPKDHDDNSLEFISGKLGFTVAKDYVITESYLQAQTKDQLVKLAKEIELDKYLKVRFKGLPCNLDIMKKTELIKQFLKVGFDLVGKVPKELIK
ncbi:MAG: ParB/RepB/Spo0J family partition protein [Sulfuricurvum sp.]|nr:ParB/RepB/Spo0J family partition protein [Sulfuricurvum sp.]